MIALSGVSSPIEKATSPACSKPASTHSDNDRCSRHPVAANTTWEPPSMAGVVTAAPLAPLSEQERIADRLDEAFVLMSELADFLK